MNVLSVILAAELVLPIAEVTERPDRQESRYPGRVTPIAKVEVVPQVSGEIKAVQFENGQGFNVFYKFNDFFRSHDSTSIHIF